MAAVIIKTDTENVTKVFTEKIVNFMRKNDAAFDGDMVLCGWGRNIYLGEYEQIGYNSLFKKNCVFLYNQSEFVDVAQQLRGMTKAKALEVMHGKLLKFAELMLKKEVGAYHKGKDRRREKVKAALKSNEVSMRIANGKEELVVTTNEDIIKFSLYPTQPYKLVFYGDVSIAHTEKLDSAEGPLYDKEFGFDVFHELIKKESVRECILDFYQANKIKVEKRKKQTNIKLIR